MAREITTINELQAYFAGVMKRADHHAGNVNDVAMAIAGAVIWRKDPAHDIEIMERQGNAGNAMWVYINGNRYAISYDHSTQTIDIRNRTTRKANTLRSFTNADSAADVAQYFDSL